MLDENHGFVGVVGEVDGNAPHLVEGAMYRNESSPVQLTFTRSSCSPQVVCEKQRGLRPTIASTSECGSTPRRRVGE